MLGPAKSIALLGLSGVILDGLGGLYLAYNLLGGKRGPLRQLSRVLTYSAIFGLGYGITLGLAFGLAGALVSGPTVDYQLRRRAKEIKPTRIEWVLTSSGRGLSFGIAGWMAVGRDFGVAFSVLTTIAMIITYELGFGTNTYRAYVRPRLDRRLALAGTIRGMLIGLAGFVSGAIVQRPEALLYYYCNTRSVKPRDIRLRIAIVRMVGGQSAKNNDSCFLPAK